MRKAKKYTEDYMIKLLLLHKSAIVEEVVQHLQKSPAATPDYAAFLAGKEGHKRVSIYVRLSIASIKDPTPFFEDQKIIGRLRAEQGYPLSGVLDVSVQTKKAIWDIILSNICTYGDYNYQNDVFVPLSLMLILQKLENALDASRVILAMGYIDSYEAKVLTQKKYLESVYQISTSAFSPNDLSKAIYEAINRSKDTFEAYDCGFVSYNPNYEYSISGNATFSSLTYRVKNKIQQLVDSYKPKIIKVMTREGLKRRLEKWIIIKISIYDEDVGLLYIRRPRFPLGLDKLNLLRSFANALGSAVANVRLFKTMAEKERLSKELTIKTINAREEERRLLAAELHDSPLQLLSATSYLLEACEEVLPVNNQELIENVKITKNSIREAVRAMRRIVNNLRPPLLDDLGVVAAIRKLVEGSASENKLRINIHVRGSQRRLPPHYELVMYRVVQEALNNINRHSNASEAKISLRFYKSFVGIVVRDNGVGFPMDKDPQYLERQSRYGLIGMSERVNSINGRISIKSKPGKGTIIRAIIPLEPIIQANSQFSVELT